MKDVHLQLSGPGFLSEVYQLNDGLSLFDVIKLTVFPTDDFSLPADVPLGPAINSAHYVVRKKQQKIEIVQRGWMSVSQRITLGIPLHPDRMNSSDWLALLGIGLKLADRIDRAVKKMAILALWLP